MNNGQHKQTSDTGRRMSAKTLPRLRLVDTLLPVELRLDRQPLKPASFPHIKAMSRSAVKFPQVELVPARLISQSSFAASAAAATALAPALAIAEPTLEGLDDFTKTTSEPLWHSLFSPESDGPQRVLEPALPDPLPTFSYEKLRESGSDWAEAGNIDLGLTESKTQTLQIPEEPKKRVWMWQAVEGLFLSKTFSRAVATAMVLLFLSTMDVPGRDWMKLKMSKAGEPIAAAMGHLSQPIRERAAFFIVDDFTGGLDHWEGSRALKVDPAGWIKVQEGLALNGKTTRLKDYRLDFDAKIQSRAVGWAVRAPDSMNYYQLKLKMGGSVASPTYSLVRQAMINGVKSAVSEPIEVPAHLAKAHDFNRVSVRVVGDQITTLINGWGVDFWRDDRLERGGVGLVADAGESSLVRKMTVSGNDDTWGMILYGAVESMRSVEGFFGGGGPAPAMIVFYRPNPAPLAQPILLQGR